MSDLSQVKPTRNPDWILANARKLLKRAIATAKKKNDPDAISIGNRGLIYAGEKPPNQKIDPILSSAELAVLAVHMRVKLDLPLRPNVKAALLGVLDPDHLGSISKKADSALGGLMVLCPKDVSDYLNDGAISAIVDARSYLKS